MVKLPDPTFAALPIAVLYSPVVFEDNADHPQAVFPHAVVLLGFNTVRNAVVSISVIDAFDVEDGMDGFDLADFWKHSIAVAVTSKHLAERAQTCPSDDCFVGGLLHDMGKVVLLRHFRDIFQKVWLAAREDEQSFHEAEKGQMQIDHASIGGHLAKKWQLPSSLIDAIRCHHTMYSKVSDFDLLKVVYTADVLVNAYDGDAEVDPASLDIHPGAAKALRRELDTLSDWYPEALLEIESACSFFSTEGA